MILVLAQISNLWKRNVINMETNSASKKLVLTVIKKKKAAKTRKPKRLHLVIL